MTKKLIYGSLIMITLLSGCVEEDTDTEGTDSTSTERTESNQENVSGTENSIQGSTISEPTTTPIESVTSEPTIVPVELVNQAPMVNAGSDRSVIVNETITLTGSASDSDGTISSIEWKKGNEVLATTLSFSYTPTEVGTDILTLEVIDNDGEKSSDEVKIIVNSEQETTNEEDETNSDFGIKK